MKKPCPARIALPLLLLLFAACGGTAPGDGASSAGDSAEIYVVRGEVVGLPDPRQPAVGFYVRHEAIDGYKDADGTVVGMDAMTMQFPLSDPSLLEGVAIGDKVELTYVVDWHGDPLQNVSALSKLPADVELEFREARR